LAILAKRWCLDSSKVIHILTTKQARYVHMVIDYDNPGHPACPLRALKGRHMKPISVPASVGDYIQTFVNEFEHQHRARGGRYPIQAGDHIAAMLEEHNIRRADGSPAWLPAHRVALCRQDMRTPTTGQ
ncbi:hypothetical protein C8A05DRAFT_17225, partial [Staphylotrichum tortipilum]